MKREGILHPLLFAIYAVLAPLALNLGQVAPSLSVRLLVLVPVGVVILGVALRLIVKNWMRAGLLTSACIFVFLYFGHVYRFLKGVPIADPLVRYPVLVFGIWALLVSAVAWWGWHLGSGLQVFTRFLNIVAIVALIWPVSFLAVYFNQVLRDPLANWTPPPRASDETVRLAGSDHPDIYYIILDGYARADILSEFYHFDNTPLVRFLVERGFYVPAESHSNYDQTSLSLASSLNMEYLDYLSAVSRESRSGNPLFGLIQNSRVRVLLHKVGYRTVALSSGYPFTEITDADVYLSRYPNAPNQFEGLWLSTTAADLFESVLPLAGYTTHRERIRYAFEALGSVPAIQGPKFVFVHILVPHPPFVFDRDGRAAEAKRPYTIGDGTDFQGTTAEYIAGYSNQVAYVNAQLTKAVDAILANSKSRPIIIVQGDHGPGSLWDWTSEARSCLRERFSILNAYYLPNAGAGKIYDSITPVNSFRVVFNTYFDAKVSLLEDESYYSGGERPYDFAKVTGKLVACGAP